MLTLHQTNDMKFIYTFLIITILSACGNGHLHDGEKLMDKGKAFMIEGKRDSAFVYFSLIADRYSDDMDEDDKRMTALALNNCGYICLFFHSDYTQAYSYLIKAKDLCEQYNITSAVPIVMQNLGNLYSACGSQIGMRNNLATAAQYYRQSVDAAVKARDWNIMLSSYINLTNLYLCNDLGKRPITQEISIPTDSVPQSGVKRYVELLNAAMRNVGKGKPAEARQLFRQQFDAIRDLDNAEQYASVTYSMITASFMQQNLADSAISCLQEYLSLARRHNNMETQTDIYKSMEKAYRMKGDDASATACHNMYLNCKDSLLFRNHLANINEMHLSHEVKIAGERIEKISTEKRIQTIMIIATAIVIVVTLYLLTIIYRRNRRLDERNRTLYERNVELLRHEAELRETRKKADENNSGNTQKSEKPVINEEKQTELCNKIQKILDDVEIITSPTFNLSRLSELVGSNTTYVSRIINETHGKGLSILLSDLRIKEACRRINNPKEYGQFTLETISASVGFKSRSTFLTAFKRTTGLLPSEYLKIARTKKHG